MEKKTYIVTAPLYSPNGPLHIGHVAGSALSPDIYARYQREKGNKVIFISGSDEAGAAITLTAKKLNITPQQLVDRYHPLNEKSLRNLGINFDIFSRTSSKHHHQVASEFFLHLHKKNIFTIHEIEQYYDQKENIFLADRYIKGTCPKCKYQEAYGDQCEQCGSMLSPYQLIDPKSTLSNTPLVKKKTKHWYLPLDKYQAWLKKWILEEHTEWKSNVYAQCKSFLEQGLQSRPMTRDINWGVPVPLKEAKGKVLYVWFEALIGYISATQIWAKKHNKDWKSLWQNPKTKLIHFIGKDNIIFHCLIFPIMLKAHGNYILPHNIPANEFMNLEGQKISTSRGNAIWMHEGLKQYPNPDIWRYTLGVEAPETKDTNFTWAGFKARVNNELVGVLGNFIHRTLILIQKYFDGKIPPKYTYTNVDQVLLDKIQRVPGQVEEAIETFKFKKAFGLWMDLAHIGNKYLSNTSPWKVISDDLDRTRTILHLSTQLIAKIAILSRPLLPFTYKKLADILNLPNYSWDDAGKVTLLPTGHIIKKPYILFSKI